MLQCRNLWDRPRDQPATFTGPGGKWDQPKIQATAHNPDATANTTVTKYTPGERGAEGPRSSRDSLPLGNATVRKSAVITSPPTTECRQFEILSQVSGQGAAH